MTRMVTAGGPSGWQLPRRVAYVVSHAFPWSANGYAVRSDGVARALQAAGHEVIVFTRPGRPWDIDGFPRGREVVLDQHIDGLRHVCLPLDPLPRARPIARVRAMADVLTTAFRVFRPAAVLAASNWETAEPARRAAGRVGAAFFYEQRGFWAMDPQAETVAEREECARETEIARDARLVLTLGTAMQAELIRRGVPRGQVALVPNGLDPRPVVAGPTSRAALGITAARVLGYIGALNDYEGVEDLLAAVAQLRTGPAAPDVAALIVGADVPKGLIGGTPGPVLARLQQQARDLGIAGHVHFVPQQPAAVAAAYYALCDVIVLPRRRDRMTALVPPVKPLTAAAHGVPVVMSDLPPLVEIAATTGARLFPAGDLAALVAALQAELALAPRRLPVPAGLDWNTQVAPISTALARVARAAAVANARRFAGLAGPATGGGPVAMLAEEEFDLAALPRVALAPDPGPVVPVVRIGPTDPTARAAGRSSEAGSGRVAEGHAPGRASSVADGSTIRAEGAEDIASGGLVAAGRAGPKSGSDMGSDMGPWLIRPIPGTLREVLALTPPGRFVIDWAGLQAESPAESSGGDAGEWAGLWGLDDMRLNRLMMDAVRIARQQGWRVQVIGPVDRGAAPLYRTVAAVVEELIAPEASTMATPDRIEALAGVAAGKSAAASSSATGKGAGREITPDGLIRARPGLLVGRRGGS